MKKYLIGLLLLLSLACTNLNQKKNENGNSGSIKMDTITPLRPNSDGVTNLNKDLITCNQIFHPFEDFNLKLINACHFVFNDSSNQILILKVGSDELREDSNFEIDTMQFLKYDLKNDSIIIDFYFLNYPFNNYKTSIIKKDSSYILGLQSFGKFNQQFASRLHKFRWIFIQKVKNRRLYFKLEA